MECRKEGSYRLGSHLVQMYNISVKDYYDTFYGAGALIGGKL